VTSTTRPPKVGPDDGQPPGGGRSIEGHDDEALALRRPTQAAADVVDGESPFGGRSSSRSCGPSWRLDPRGPLCEDVAIRDVQPLGDVFGPEAPFH